MNVIFCDEKSTVNEQIGLKRMPARRMHVADKFCLTGFKAHATEKYVNSLGNICPSTTSYTT